mmetsp:Transcript_70552/g.86553  ORF Transcript_70552/g.86553 Transcript_70552/m.86553 type:complete len:95 (+) Transcript_70552:51-335(+)
MPQLNLKLSTSDNYNETEYEHILAAFHWCDKENSVHVSYMRNRLNSKYGYTCFVLKDCNWRDNYNLTWDKIDYGWYVWQLSETKWDIIIIRKIK